MRFIKDILFNRSFFLKNISSLDIYGLRAANKKFRGHNPYNLIYRIAIILGFSKKEPAGESVYYFVQEKLGISLNELTELLNQETPRKMADYVRALKEPEVDDPTQIY